MRSLILAALLALVALPAGAQTSKLVLCTAGCTIASDPFPLDKPQPVACEVRKAGVLIAGGPGVTSVQPSTKVLTSNGSVADPEDPPYDPGPAGSIACYVWIPAQPAGPVTLTWRAVGAKGDYDKSGDPVITFTSVTALPPKYPPKPVAARATP